MEVLPDGRLRLATDVVLPAVLDVLIVGGGPAGTATAFRAKELGLSALVIEIDDVLKRIRDYDAAKPIKPDFGAGKQMGFPKGGELIEDLHFFSDIRGSDLCEAWKTLYVRHSVPVQVGIELLGLEPHHGGVWRALVRNHRLEQEGVLLAQHVVLALGAGMSRRLDVPGDVRAISYRLTDASRYVGSPACVIGGGVSAAEAVIAISDAKAAKGDTAAVYWSHRGDEMPRVPAALQDAMKRARSVNNNVRLLPASEAREVAHLDSGKVLRVQVERRSEPGAPVETTTVEFDASQVIACIGQEIDWTLMNGIGIYQVTGGKRVRKAIPLNALLECRQPNVYIIGDTLNIAYLECADFDGDVSAFREVKHRGNIKASLIDGVKVAEVIAQRLAGKPEIRIELEFVGGAEPESPPPAVLTGVPGDTLETVEPSPPADGPPLAVLTRLLDRAVEAEQFVLQTGRATTIGKRYVDICFESDSRLADTHASIVPDGKRYALRDEGSRDGVFLHLTEGRSRAVAPGAVARLGSQWLVFGAKDDPMRLCHHDALGRLVGLHRLKEGTQLIGRDAPDVTLAVGDKGLSRRHASVVVTGDQVVVRDLNSVNGIYLKVEGSVSLDEGDIVRVGHQALRFSLLEAVVHSESISLSSGPFERPAMAQPLETAGPIEGSVVRFTNRGQTCPFEKGQTICDVAEAAGIKISADCHSGICGSDPIRVVSGSEHLNAQSSGERDTLEDICALDPETHRLACVSRLAGPVVVEIVEG